MAEPRRSHQALADGRAHLAKATRLVAALPPIDGATGREEVTRALSAATESCAELIQLLTMEEQLSLTAIRGNAQIALRRLEMGGDSIDPAALRTALRAIIAAADRLMRQVEALETAAADSSDSH